MKTSASSPVRATLLSLIAGWTLAGHVACYDDCDLKIKTDVLPIGAVGFEYRFNLDSGCGGDDWFVNDGTLPPGIQLQSDGDLRGVPTVAGSFNFNVGVYDFGSDETAFKGFQITIAVAPAPTPTPTVGPT
jgi:hypothetical protein